MELYLYKAKQIGNSKIISSQGRFESEAHVNQYLIQNRMVPLKVKKKTAMTKDLSELAVFGQSIKLVDLVFFCRQFSVMLEAGISIGGALGILGQQTDNTALQKVVQEIDSEVQKGSNLSHAMAKQEGFPDLLIGMIKSGETTGNMGGIMEKMALHFESQLDLRRNVKKAMTYPLMVMTTMAALIPVLMVKVLPAFVAMFEDSGIQLPLPTRMVMGFSDWMIDYLYILMIISLGIWVGLYLAYKSQAGRRVFDLMALKMPGLSVLNKKSLTALFSDTLALLITSGVPVFQSLEILKEVLGNTIAKEEMDHTLNQVRQGNTISSTLVDSKIYPKMMVSMIRIGEETGALDEMLIKTSQYYKKEVDAAIGQVTLFIEPILILFIALVIGGIMLAVLLPTFTMATELM